MRYMLLLLGACTCGPAASSTPNTSELAPMPSIAESSEPITLVLLHGFGGQPSDLDAAVAFFETEGSLQIVRPRAPFDNDSGGAYWFSFFAGDKTDREMRYSRELLHKILDDLRRDGAQNIVVGGFSQGAMMALDVALHHRELVDAAIISSGAIQPQWREYAGIRGMPILITHGRSDQSVGFQESVQMRERLEAAGAVVQFFGYDGDHSLPRPAQARIARFLERLRTPSEDPAEQEQKEHPSEPEPEPEQEQQPEQAPRGQLELEQP